MGRVDDDDFEEDDFSLSDGTEDDKDGSASEASVAEEEDEEEEEEEDDDEGGWSGEDDDASDFESAKPKAKKAKASSAPSSKAKRASPAALKAKDAKATPAVAKKAAGSGAKASTPVAAKGGASTSRTTSSPKAPTTAKAAEKPAPTIKGDPTAHVLDYMRKTNRPYSMLNVFENLHRAIAKPALTKILDNLADKEELASKTYGKAKIYYMNQDKLPVPSEEERRDVEDQIKQVEADCAVLDQELKGAEGALSSINAQISDADLDKTLAQLEEESVALESKLASLERPDRPPIPAGRKDALKRKFTVYRTAWVARKRIVTDAVNQVADGMEKKPKDVYDMIGIETDAEAGIKEIPSI